MNDAPAPPAPRFDRSDLIAVIALIISVLGTVAALWQNSILSEQLEIASEQKGASALPLLNVKHSLEYVDSIPAWRYAVGIKNEGVGPALLGSATYRYRGREVDLMTFAEDLGRGRPGFDQVAAEYVGNELIAPGQLVESMTIRVPVDSFGLDSIVTVSEELVLQMCYCSVYGDCWEYVREEWPTRTPSCVGVPRL